MERITRSYQIWLLLRLEKYKVSSQLILALLFFLWALGTVRYCPEWATSPLVCRGKRGRRCVIEGISQPKMWVTLYLLSYERGCQVVARLSRGIATIPDCETVVPL